MIRKMMLDCNTPGARVIRGLKWIRTWVRELVGEAVGKHEYSTVICVHSGGNFYLDGGLQDPSMSTYTSIEDYGTLNRNIGLSLNKKLCRNQQISLV